MTVRQLEIPSTVTIVVNGEELDLKDFNLKHEDHHDPLTTKRERWHIELWTAQVLPSDGYTKVIIRDAQFGSFPMWFKLRAVYRERGKFTYVGETQWI